MTQKIHVFESHFHCDKDAFTPKELCHIAQGCERSELPWENDSTSPYTP